MGWYSSSKTRSSRVNSVIERRRFKYTSIVHRSTASVSYWKCKRVSCSGRVGESQVSVINASSRSPKRLWHALHRILVAADVHARYARNFTYPSSQLLIARRHDEASPLLGHLD